MTFTVMIYSMGEVIGDGLIKLPFIAALRRAYPQAHIVWCAAKGETVYSGPLRAVVEGLIDEVLTEGVLGAGLFDLVQPKPFGGRRFDLVIDTQDNPRRSLVAKRSAVRFISSAADFRLSDSKPSDGTVQPDAVIDRLTQLLSLATGQPTPLAPINLAGARAGRAALALLPDGPCYIGLAPGAGGQDKRWPLEQYLALARAQLGLGRMPVFFFGPDEQADRAVAQGALPQALFPEVDRQDDFADIKGPLLVIALAGRLAAAVANDAGPGHMMAAGGAPLLSLQKDRRKAVKFRPSAQRLSILIAEDYGQDMAALPLDVVQTALDALLSGDTL
jgi:ADP-heptose:LPS heptosyltransferase